MRRLLATTVLAAACSLCLPAPVAEASEAEAKKEYQQRTREVRKAGDPMGWLRLGTWIEAHRDISEKTRKRWLTYIRHQYGVAAKKLLADDDVDGWIELAETMKRLLGSDSTPRSYLRTALQNNPGSEKLAAALGETPNGGREVASIQWKAKKAAAEEEGTPEAFGKLAAWCAGQREDNSQAEDWHTYCVARELYLSGREGGATDPIRKALEEAKRADERPAREADEPRVSLPTHLGKRKSKALRGEEFKDKRTYRLESKGRVSYTDTLPASRTADAVWKRGTRTTHTMVGNSEIWMETHPAWWELKWDDEAKGWVEHTRADFRAAEKLQLKTAHERLARAERRLADVTKKLERLPKDAERSREFAERIARNGGKVKDFRRALQGIVSRAGSAHYNRTEKLEAERAVAAWRAKIADMTPPPAEMDDPPKAEMEQPGK